MCVSVINLCIYVSMITHVCVHPWSHVYVHLHLCRRICLLEPVHVCAWQPKVAIHQVSSTIILHLRRRDKAFYLNLELIDLAWLTRQFVLRILPLPLTLGLQVDEPGFCRGAEKLNSGPHAYTEQHPSLEFIVFENEWKWWMESGFAFLTCSPGRSQTCSVANNGLNLRILSLPPKCWTYRCATYVWFM